MKPIRLTEYNEYLCEYPGDDRADHLVELSCCIGVHDVCNGWMDIADVSADHSALRCRRCGLRVVIPKSVRTMADLRTHMEKTLPKQKR